MLAPRNRGAFATIGLGLLALASACSNGTEPKQNLCDFRESVVAQRRRSANARSTLELRVRFWRQRGW